jgi:hypothetical protein
MKDGNTIEAAAAAAGMSPRSAHTWKTGPLPSQTKRERHWRTRPDAFKDVWKTDVVPLLQRDEGGALEATTVLAELQRQYGDRFGEPLLRTLQRRIHEWRAHHGPSKEVFFEQQHVVGREAAFDFTDCGELGVTIAGEPFAHLLFQLILSYSKWRFVGLAFSETFEALLRGVQDALWELGGVPETLRSDNLSAATHEIPSGGRELNRRFAAVLEHYGMRSTRIEPGKSNQNGVVEKAHDRLKTQIDQALIVRGSRDFADVTQYSEFVGAIRQQLNRNAGERVAQERAALKPLPSTRLPNYTQYDVVVRKWSTIHFGRRTYSVPSRLIGCSVEVRQYADVVDVFYRGKLTASMPRLRGERAHSIDYRHVIWSLVRKPGAFARYRFREELFPTLTFRRAYDVLVQTRGERADVEYVRILHLAASTLQSYVANALTVLLERGERLDYAAVKAIAAPETPAVPDIQIPAPDPAAYDSLLVSGGES